MFNPLMSDFSQMKDIDIENKIVELNKKYSIAARSGSNVLCHQILMALEVYKEEMSIRMAEKTKKMLDKDSDMGKLINID